MPNKNWIEWAVFAVSAVLIAGVVAALAVEAVAIDDSPPQLAVSIGETITQPSGFGVLLSVQNSGGDTAESVHLELTLRGEQEASGECQIAFVPRLSQGECWAMLNADPASGELEARVLGFEQP